MRINIRFDYVNSTWEIAIHENGRYVSVNGKTLSECFTNLKDYQLVNQIKVWFDDIRN